MSIIAAIISRHSGVVLSDGRIFKSVQLCNGKPVSPAIVEGETFNKTFVLSGGAVIGAFAGLMGFSGKAVGEHMGGLPFDTDTICTLDQVGRLVESEFIRLLQGVCSQEVVLAERKLDVLLVGRKGLKEGDFQIAVLRFLPDIGNATIGCQRSIIPSPQKAKCYKLLGDDAATAAAAKLLYADRAPNADINFLLKLGNRAVRAGIAAARGHIYNHHEKSCGGDIFSRNLS